MDDDTSLAVVTAEELLLLLLVLVFVLLLVFAFVSFRCWLEFWLEFADVVATAGAEENNDNTPPIKKHNLLLIVDIFVVAVSSAFESEFSDDVEQANVVLFELGEDDGTVEVIQVLPDDEVLKFNRMPGQQQKHINLNLIV